MAPATSLTVIYVLAVVLVAFRSGGGAALITAVLAVILFDFLFVEPRFALEVTSSRDLVALLVFLAVAVAVGRLAAIARDRTAEAAAREREAELLAATASSVLTSSGSTARTGGPLEGFAAAIPDQGRSGVRIAIGERPVGTGVESVPFETGFGTAWLTGDSAEGWDDASLLRLADPLAELCRVAEERAQVAGRQARTEATERADRAKTALLHSVSHDLRSPLTAISTAASAMDPARLPDADHAALLAVITEESDRLARLVDDLLDVSKIQAGAVNPRVDWCHVNEVASRAVSLVRRGSTHPIEVDLPDDVLLVRADSVQLERVFVNLIENAVKHSPADGPAVRVSGGVGGGRVHVRVTDRGRGIPLSRRKQVFEPFFRGRGSEGSGLGLAISRGFADANGGEIRIQDVPGGGTSFSVSFPLAVETAEA